MNLQGKIAVVTGGAMGNGKGIVESLLKYGASVVILDKSSELTNTVNELGSKGYKVLGINVDISNKNLLIQVVDIIKKYYDHVDILVNNAGIAQFKEFTQITDGDWNNMINTNLNSVFIMSQEVLNNMIHNKSGCIINISSIWGMVGSSCEVHYSTAKAGINGMTKSLAKELGPSNIRVNAIAPGVIDTDMNSNLSEEEIKELENETPLGRIGKPQDIAKCVEWLIEDKFTTGQVISVNGGWIIT